MPYEMKPALIGILTAAALFSATAAADTQVSAGAAPSSERFNVAGLTLGATPHETTAIMNANGYSGKSGDRSAVFTHAGNGRRVMANYSRQTKDTPPQLEQFMLTIPRNAGGEVYQHLLSNYGAPDACPNLREIEGLPMNCSWARSFDGWSETLEWRRGNGWYVIVRGSVADSTKFSQLAGAAPVVDANTSIAEPISTESEQAAPPLKPAAANETDETWWSKELAAAEEAGLGTAFTAANGFANLSAEEKQKMRGEAGHVYDYCRNTSIFSSLHDCRCVAEKFVDARLNPPPPPAEHPAISGCDPHLARGDRQAYDKCRQAFASRSWQQEQQERDVIAIADDVADQCPSKAGAAAYAEAQCKTSYASRLGPNDVRPFCHCYAEAFAENYMSGPRRGSASTPNLTNVGTAAIQACADHGWRR